MWKRSMILQLLFILWFNRKTIICSNLEEGLELGLQLNDIYTKAENLLISFAEVLDVLGNYSNTDPDFDPLFGDVNEMPSLCLSAPINTTGIYAFKVPGQKPFPVLSDSSLAGLGWIVIQRRNNGSLNFYRNWDEYRQGFGNLYGEFFLGLEKVRAITALEPYELYIHLEDFNKTIRHARYDEFAIDNEAGSYALNVLGRYTGTAGDSLRSHFRMKFSTYDRDNDHEFARNCAFSYVGAWWYNACLDSNLNGQYIEGGKYEERMFARGMCWRSWHGHNYGYKITQMMIRPKCRNICSHSD